MGKINVARVILGGLLAGLVINISEYVLNMYVIADEVDGDDGALGLAVPRRPSNRHPRRDDVRAGHRLDLLAGLRPRFGAGAKTAVIAALIIWIVAVMAAFADVVLGITPANLLAMGAAWSLVEMIVAAVAGAWLYKESA